MRKLYKNLFYNEAEIIRKFLGGMRPATFDSINDIEEYFDFVRTNQEFMDDSCQDEMALIACKRRWNFYHTGKY
jgi:hypothetical protein